MSDPSVLYSTGYLGDKRAYKRDGKVATFDAMVQRVGLLVCDIRLNPYSLAPCWRKAEMCERLGNAQTFPDGRYLHIPELGNLNYKNGGPIKIVNLEYGVNLVLESAAAACLSPLLLCGCEDYDCCHRYEVGMAFRGRVRKWGEITHWVNPTAVGRGEEGDVFGVDLTYAGPMVKAA